MLLENLIFRMIFFLKNRNVFTGLVPEDDLAFDATFNLIFC